MNVIGLLSYGNNPGACLIKDGKIKYMIEEERINRIKTSSNIRPVLSIKEILQREGLSFNDIDEIAIGWDNNKYPEYMEEFQRDNLPVQPDVLGDTIKRKHLIEFNASYEIAQLSLSLKKLGINGEIPPINFYSHHLSHAASTYYLSGFKESIILTIDGSGEEITTGIYIGKDKEITEIETYLQPNSLGWFYSAFTEFLGFNAYSGEGKLMGLAPYGKKNEGIKQKLQQVLRWDEHQQQYHLDSSYIYFGKRNYSQRFTDNLVTLFGKPRYRDDEEITQFHKDLAYEVQSLLEAIVIRMVKKHVNKYNIRNICLAGGVALNCKLNGRISKLNKVKNVFVTPSSNDAGTAIGAALLASKKKNDITINRQLTHAYYGSKYSNEYIKKLLDKYKLKYRWIDCVEEYAAEKINIGKIIGWFQGRMEFGSRALGNRSILANPCLSHMKDTVNEEIKNREWFRPFAPSILKEYQHEIIENGAHSPFMLIADSVKKDVRDKIPSVVHVDNTVRHQTVSRETNKRYWNLINAFYKLSGLPLVLNTSFNVRGEPIVMSPEDAIRCFYSTGLDILVIENYVLEK